MKLKKKILTGYGVSFALMAVVIAWAVVNLVALGKASDAILRENYRSILATENMVNALERQDSAILLILLGEIRHGATQFRESEAAFLQWLARAKDNITIQGENELIRNIETVYSQYRTRYDGLCVPNVENKPSLQSARSMYHQLVYPLFEQVRAQCIELRLINEQAMHSASARAARIAARAIWSTSAVAASVLLISLIFSLIISEKIVRPLQHLVKVSRQIASGHYDVQASVESGDELGRLAEEFNQMTAQLNRYQQMNIEHILSEKQKSEAILASIEDGLVVLDPALNVTSINPAARRMLHLTFNEDMDLHFPKILPAPRIWDIVKQISETGVEPQVPEEERILSLKNGEHSRHCVFSVATIRGREQSPAGIVILFRDVTRLLEVELLKNEFIMAASHELRTPLTSIGMSIALLLEHAAQQLNPNDRELLQAANEEVNRLKALINDLLDLSRMEAGRIDLEFETVEIRKLLENIETIFRNQLMQKSIELSNQLPEDLPKIRVDANKITWVLTNLISNALRYVESGGHIQIQGSKVGVYVHLSVRDDGPGIPLEYQTKIFQKFVQVKGRQIGGTGLGLAICKEIVRAHGGTIWVESTPGAGCTFTFTVPAVQ